MEKKRKKTTKKNSMKSLHKTAVSHLKQDIKGYKKQKKHISEEIQEDKNLIKKIKGTKNGSSKKKTKACCKNCQDRS